MKTQLLSDLLQKSLVEIGFDGITVDPIKKANCGCSTKKYFINLNYKGHPVRIQRPEPFWRDVLTDEQKFEDLVELSKNMLNVIYD